MLVHENLSGIKKKLKFGLVTGLAAIIFGCGNSIENYVDRYNKISFVSDRNGNYDIYTIDPDGSNLEQITDTPWNEYSHTWSSDGKEIVYQSDEKSDPDMDEYYMNIFKINSDGTGKVQLTNSEAGVYNGMPDLSPNGKQIVFVSNRESRDSHNLYIIDIDGNNLKKLTDSGADYNHFQPEFNHDGSEIAFSKYEIYGPLSIINILNLKDSSIKEIENGAEATQTPTFSPDGRFIAFCSNLSDPVNFLVNVGTINLDTREVKELTTNGRSYNPSWSPDGKEIVYQFLNEDTGKNSVRKINLETNEETILVGSDDFNNTAPSWFLYSKQKGNNL